MSLVISARITKDKKRQNDAKFSPQTYQNNAWCPKVQSHIGLLVMSYGLLLTDTGMKLKRKEN